MEEGQEFEIWINYYGDNLKKFKTCIDYLTTVSKVTIEATNFVNKLHVRLDITGTTKEQFVKDSEQFFCNISKKDYIWLYSKEENNAFCFGFQCGLRMSVLG
jgi:hypothetical protein